MLHCVPIQCNEPYSAASTCSATVLVAAGGTEATVANNNTTALHNAIVTGVILKLYEQTTTPQCGVIRNSATFNYKMIPCGVAFEEY